MRVLKVPKTGLVADTKKLAGSYRVFAPVKERDYHNFKRIGDEETPDFEFLNTRLSAKHAVYPQSEKMLCYTLDKESPDYAINKEAEKDHSPMAVVGIRPCDAKAYELVRVNFDTPEYRDPYWMGNYESLTRVGLACQNPCASCFCTTAGSGPHDESAVDVLLVDNGDHYLAKVLNDKGEAVAKAAGWTEEAGEDAAAALEAKKAEAEAKITSKVDSAKIPNKVILDLYNADFWEDVAFACINCGTCTYLCPTCWCFDIQDEVNGTEGIRIKNWDSCMFPLFTLHGSGHNPRPDKTARVRQRFMHKLKYYVDKYGDGIMCVGCGRCVQQCPVNIDVRRVLGLMNEYEKTDACAL